MGYEYFYQNIAEGLLLSMLIFIDSPLQILILDNFFIFFINAAPTTVASGHKNQLQPDARLCETSTRPWEILVSREVSSCKVGLARTCKTLVSREVSSRKVGLARSLVLAKTP